MSQQAQQYAFCDILNNNYSHVGVSTTSPSGALFSRRSPVSFHFEPYHENEVFKRRLSDVSWSLTMEVSEEKRFKVNKNEQ